MLLLKNFFASVEEKDILHGINLAVKPGEIHAVMGPNGSGKTSLVMSMMGHPGYNFKFPMSNFKFQIDGKDMSRLLPEERARAGLFVSFQSPIELTGISFLAFLRTAAKALRPEEKIPLSQFKQQVADALAAVSLDENFMQRSVNEGFSGGERKRAEVAQLLVLKPKFAILDEIDSGLDVDSLKLVASAIDTAVKKHNIGVLLITHYQRILHFLKPHMVHVLVQGKIKKSDGMSLVQKIEKEGYAAI